MNTSFNSEAKPTPVSFNANVLTARAAAAHEAQQAGSEATSEHSPESIRAAAQQAVDTDILATRLNGDARLLNRWKANNASFYKYKLGLVVAQLGGGSAGISIDTDRLATGVRAAQAGGELRKNGEAKGIREGASIEVKSTDRPRVIRLPNGGLLDSWNGVTVSKARAATLGYVEGAAK